LLQKGAISEKEYYTRYQAYLDDANSLNKMRNEAFQQANKKDNIEDDFADNANKLELEVLNLQSEYLTHQRTLEQEEARKKELQTKLSMQGRELDKLTIISEIDGYATNLYNTQKDVNLVLKNQTLLIVTPFSEEKFYANFKVNEKEIRDIRVGQKVHIKISAYDHYKFGILKGTITHINKEMGAEKQSGSNDLFYVLVDLPDEELKKMDIKSGFKVSGEIIIRKVKLYQYFFKSIFKKI
jgi:multidrug resistance efflux pump